MALTKLIRTRNDIENVGRARVINFHGAHYNAIELCLQPCTLVEPIERCPVFVKKLLSHPHYRSRIIPRRVGQHLAKMIMVGATELILYDYRSASSIPSSYVQREAAYRSLGLYELYVI